MELLRLDSLSVANLNSHSKPFWEVAKECLDKVTLDQLRQNIDESQLPALDNIIDNILRDPNFESQIERDHQIVDNNGDENYDEEQMKDEDEIDVQNLE